MGHYMKQEYDARVIAVRIRAVVTDDHRLELIVPDEIPPGEVEVVLVSPSKRDMSAQDDGGLDPDVRRALNFFQTIQQRSANQKREVCERTLIDEEQAEDVRPQ